jgi:tRNA dimethylallyltransferase
MSEQTRQDSAGGRLLCIIGPTASGKSARAVEEALKRGGEVISVDSRQVYRRLDIGTEKITPEEMHGVPHHLIDIRDAGEQYSAGDFVADAERIIGEIRARGKEPVLAGGSHFYFDSLLYGLPYAPQAPAELRAKLEALSDEELFAQVQQRDPRRATQLDRKNRRRVIRALEIIALHGAVPDRSRETPRYEPEWIVIDLPREELRPRIDKRLESAFQRGLIDEARRVREEVGDERLGELGLEYRIVGEYLRGEREEAALQPALSSKLWHYARHQKAWIRKLTGTQPA